MYIIIIYHGNARKTRWSTTHMVKKEERMEKRQPSGTEPATSRSIYSQPFGS